MKTKLLFPVNSLWFRCILVISLLVLLVLSSILIARDTVQRSKNTVTNNIEKRHSITALNRDVRESLLSTQTSLDAFLLDANSDEYLNRINASLHETKQSGIKLTNMLRNMHYVEDTRLNLLSRYLDELSLAMEFLTVARRDPSLQLPLLTVRNREMRAHSEKFNNAIAFAIMEIAVEPDLTNNNFYNTLVNTSYFWSHMVSEFRLYVINRLGDFDHQALPVQEKSIASLHQILAADLQDLSDLSIKQNLDPRFHRALKKLMDIAQTWFTEFETVKNIYQLGTWRTDTNLMTTTIEPKLELIWRLLQDFDETLDTVADGDIKNLLGVADRQINFFWLISLFVFSVIALALVYSKRSVFRPIEKIGRAMRDDSIEGHRIILPRVSTSEIRNLLEAFSVMKMQIKSRQMTLEHKALHDELTSLPNRSLLFDRITQSIIVAKDEGTPIAVFVVSIANLKEIVDILGHRIGDQLLLEICTRLERFTGHSSTIARLSSNEFAVVIADTDATAAAEYSSALSVVLKMRMVLDELDVYPNIHIGIALYPRQGCEASILVQRADIAMFVARRNRRDYMIYDVKHDQFSIDRLGLLSDLKKALVGQNLEMHYQPKLDLSNQQVMGVEALIRWKHRKHGWVPASEIIAISEQSGLITPLTYWTIKTVIKQCANWKKIGLNLNVAINLSVHALQEGSIVSYIKNKLQDAKIDPGSLTIEITESAMMTNPTRVSAVLSQLKTLGLCISADDFGTGFSSLSYLKLMPIDEIKIDKSFVMQMVENKTDKIIVASAIDLAHNLGIKVVAEGIQDQDTQRVLQLLSCDIGQGYFYEKPISATELIAWLESQQMSIGLPQP